MNAFAASFTSWGEPWASTLTGSRLPQTAMWRGRMRQASRRLVRWSSSSTSAPDLARSGADVLELDHRTSLREACRILPRHIAVWGNLDPVSVLAQGSPQDVKLAAKAFIQTMTDAGHHRFVLS